MDADLGRPKYWPGIPWLRGAKKGRKRRKASGVAARAKNAPKHCKTGLSHCMKGGGKGKAGPCMRKYWSCIKGA
jgi:hypothetical protein